MSALSAYTLQVQGLLHDALNQFWTTTEITGYVNEARNRVVRDTGCNRVLQTPGYLSIGQEIYTYGGVTGFNVTAGGHSYVTAPSVTIAGGTGSGATATATVLNGAVTSIAINNPGSGYLWTDTLTVTIGGPGTGAAATASQLDANTFDIVNISLYWGNSRVVLPRWSWTRFNAQARYYQKYPGMPRVCAGYSNKQVFVQPVPDQVYTVDWDTVMQPQPLVDNTSIDVIPFPFQDAVQYYACYKAKQKGQQWGESEAFKKEYNSQVMDALRSSVTRTLANPYAYQR